MRLVRPYASRQQLLEAEGHLLGRSHAILLGLRPLPSGTCLRFELQLQDGTPLGRAECVVVQPMARGDELALRVRLLRVDATIKTLLDEAVAWRHARAARPVATVRSVPARRRETLPSAAAFSLDDERELEPSRKLVPVPLSAPRLADEHALLDDSGENDAVAGHGDDALDETTQASRGVTPHAAADAPSERTQLAPAQSGTLPRRADRDELLARLRARRAR